VKRSSGGVMIVSIAVFTVLLWLLFKPANQPTGRYLGEIFGTTAIVLFTCSLALATKLPLLEPLFGGLDRMFLWHRWTALAGVVLLLPRYLFVTSVRNSILSTLGNALGFVALVGLVVLLMWAFVPRLPVVGRRIRANYQRWFTLHRFTGLFVIVGLIHGALVDPVLRLSPILLTWYLAVATIGTAAYLVRELLMPFLRPIWRHDYIVEMVNRLNPLTVDVILKPVGQPVPFVAGQFVFVRFGGSAAWEPHPFTIASAPQEQLLHLSFKALGDHTRRLVETLQPGTPARVGLAFGKFDYLSGAHNQIWIAGGIGITPFRSWMRAFTATESLNFDIDFYYTVRNESEAMFMDEIATTAALYPSFRSHITYSERDGSLTIEQIAASSSGALAQKHVYLCGPTRMIRKFESQLRKLGVPQNHIHFEQFDFR
jgi:predicted ferric reductase